MTARGFKARIGSALLLPALVGAGVAPLSISHSQAQAQVAQKIRYGTVVAVTRTVVKVRSTGTGAVVGSTAGAVAGYALVGGRDRWLGGLVGGVLGGAAGRGIENASRKKKGWELIVKVDGGEEIGIEIPGKKQEYHERDRVRLMTGAGGQTKVTPYED